MRHLKAGKALGVTPSHRRAMLRNLVTSVLEHGRITTTITRAKELRKPLDRMIGLGKRGDLHARRQALAYVKSKAAMANLFGELAERYSGRGGGYSRIFMTGTRKGDAAQMAIVQLVDHENDPFAGEKPAPKRKAKREPDKTVLEEVAQEVRAEAKESGESPEGAGDKKD